MGLASAKRRTERYIRFHNASNGGRKEMGGGVPKRGNPLWPRLRSWARLVRTSDLSRVRRSTSGCKSSRFAGGNGHRTARSSPSGHHEFQGIPWDLGQRPTSLAQKAAFRADPCNTAVERSLAVRSTAPNHDHGVSQAWGRSTVLAGRQRSRSFSSIAIAATSRRSRLVSRGGARRETADALALSDPEAGGPAVGAQAVHSEVDHHIQRGAAGRGEVDVRVGVRFEGRAGDGFDVRVVGALHVVEL